MESIVSLMVYYYFFSCFWTSVVPCFSSKLEPDKKLTDLKMCTIGECMPLMVCRPYLHMLRIGDFEGREEVLKNTCGYENDRLKVCCPIHKPKMNLFPSKCGNSKNARRIIGGEMAEMGEHPWMAAFGYEAFGADPTFLCSGTLINARYVLTAAHCLHENDIKSRKLIVIRLGDFNLSSPLDCVRFRTSTVCSPHPIDAKPEKLIIHPSYNVVAKHSSDIALVRLDRTINLEASEGYIMPVCLPPLGFNAEYEADGRLGIAVGWGITNIAGGLDNSPDIPFRVNLPFAERKICEKYFRESLGESQICVGGEEDKDTCSGDSGGPLMLLGPKGSTYLQVGIISFGLGCGNKGIPGVYVAVSHYIDWITDSIEPW